MTITLQMSPPARSDLEGGESESLKNMSTTAVWRALSEATKLTFYQSFMMALNKQNEIGLQGLHCALCHTTNKQTQMGSICFDCLPSNESLVNGGEWYVPEPPLDLLRPRFLQLPRDAHRRERPENNKSLRVPPVLSLRSRTEIHKHTTGVMTTTRGARGGKILRKIDGRGALVSTAPTFGLLCGGSRVTAGRA